MKWVFLAMAITLNSFWGLNAQQKEIKISFNHSNDLYFLTDKYLSAENHFSFTKFLNKNEQRKHLLEITLGQQLFTPSRISKLDTTKFDRPFAGWLFLDAKLSRSSANEIWVAGITFGLTGPQSLADKLQRNYHRLINEQLPSWYLQIPNDFHLNLYFKHQRNLINKHLLTHSLVTLGTKDLFVEGGLEWFWGSHYNFFENAFSGLSNHQDAEWFISFGAFYKYTIYNALIEGSLFNNTAPFTKNIMHHNGFIQLRSFYKIKNTSLEMTYHFNTKEVNNASSHSYLSIKLSKYFEGKNKS